MASFSPLRLGKQRIPIRALLYRHSERGITKKIICERSELEVFLEINFFEFSTDGSANYRTLYR